METSAYSDQDCRKETVSFFALAGLSKAFAANTMRDRVRSGHANVGEYIALRDQAANFIGRDSCATLEPIITAPHSLEPEVQDEKEVSITSVTGK
ncbi:hypothetical protein BH09PAT3_BH09PAT3_4880 [soil metagenome]